MITMKYEIDKFDGNGDFTMWTKIITSILASTFRSPRPPTISDLLSGSRRQQPACALPSVVRRVEAGPVVERLQAANHPGRRTPKSVARGCSGNRGLTLKFTVPQQVQLGIAPFTRVDLLSVDSIEGHNQVSGKGFPTTGPRIEAGNVVIHRGLHVVVFCLDIDHGVWSWKDGVSFGSTRLICASFGGTRLICASFGSTRLICASFGSTRLICASLGITRLIGVSFGITRLIRASFGITRLICAFYGTTRLLCKGTARGRPTRGKKDA
ncbi:mucin-19-like isoform X13 [Cucumis melo var. makuwa]|uniref:Mucin-19-like isoform X13 n=1 Tax=Cucumis melo var. makuwa TaxID=1194695 RepID=A0A5A7U7N2_CUCMM|nr:mucin-19-like isoform X13 [Cucumis melo var. makuwa]